MTPRDDGDFRNIAGHRPVWRIRWIRWAAIIVLLVLIGGATGWGLRKPIAERMLAGWCAERELVCTASIERLGPDGTTLAALKITDDQHLAFEAGRVSVRLEWLGLFKPHVTGIEFDAPLAYGALADGHLDFHGLERLIPGGGGGGALPTVDIRDGRILIDTSAGQVSAALSVTGQFPQEGRLAMVLDPASLDEPQGRVRWTGGVIDIHAVEGHLKGEARFEIEEAATDDMSLSGATLTARLDTGQAGGLADGDPVHLVWESRIGRAAAGGYEGREVSSSGHIALASLNDLTFANLLESVTRIDLQLESGAVTGAAYSAGTLRLEASMHSTDGVLAGPVAIMLTDAAGPQGQARSLMATGEAGWSRQDGAAFDGEVSGKGTHLSQNLAQIATARVLLPAPLSAHGQSLQAALQKAFADFDVTARLEIQARPDGLRVTGKDKAAFQAASGLSLAVHSLTDAFWLEFDRTRTIVSGNITLSGGGAPALSASLGTFSVAKGTVGVDAKGVRVSPWTVEGASLAADLPEVSLSSEADIFELRAKGSVTLSGRLSGLDLKSTRLAGGIHARRGKAGWQVEPQGKPCLSLATQGVGIGGVDFQPITLALCPDEGGYVGGGPDAASGTVRLGDVEWPFRSKSVTGVLALDQAVLDWAARKGVAFTVSAPSLDLPLDIGERTLTISGAKPRIGLSTAKGQSPRLSAMLGETVLGGTLIPAKVSGRRIAFDGQIGPGGLSGDIIGNDVLIRDFREDPVYQPLVAEMSARLREGRLDLAGPLRLQASGTRVGDISADVNVLTLSGTARVASRELDFRKGGLQPVMLSERLRGVYTDAAGQMEAVSDVVIENGKLTGTADVTVRDFGFQTTRLGRVQNVNGHVRFSDLFSLTTAPSQVLTIGGMDPGVPLLDGRLSFQFSDGRILAVESAAFPFAGGTLALSPFNWTLGAETQHVEVTADAIDLDQLVRTLKLPKIEAQGTVSGRFPIDVERTKVLVRDARLLADPGGGRVAYLGNAADSAASSDANVRLAFEALKDFDFTVLEVGLDGNIADRVKITLKLAGKSRRDITYGKNANIVRGQPFEFNIAIDSALAELFRSSQFYTNQQKITDFVVREVLTDKDLKPAEDE